MNMRKPGQCIVDGFNPDEPRDPDGKWSGGGNSSWHGGGVNTAGMSEGDKKAWAESRSLHEANLELAHRNMSISMAGSGKFSIWKATPNAGPRGETYHKEVRSLGTHSTVAEALRAVKNEGLAFQSPSQRRAVEGSITATAAQEVAASFKRQSERRKTRGY